MNMINLPIDNYKSAIVNAIMDNDFLIVVGQTGCGKTTRIPQFLFNKFDQVIVTEPRILTAKTASYRVAEEMGLTVGKEIGYKTGYDRCFTADSKILFCTDGLQLVRTITMADGRKENVLVIDEIHLWNINMESLVAWCKFMRNQWKTKVVIMSATMDAHKLQRYLGGRTAIIEVPGRLFDVAVEHRPASALIPTVVEYVEENRDTVVFVSGKKEMEDVIYDIKLTGCDSVVLPLHGEMEWEDQKKCYLKYSVPKVIVATNIAQDGVTIPGISVIDTGKAKISNAESGVEGVVEIEISKADSKQREGRAGRTEGGRYTLCSDYDYEDRDDYTLPEIQRSILDRIVLQLAAAGLDAEELEFYHQPNVEDIKLAKKKLIALGATDENNNVTELGHKMVKMPISVENARMITEAEKYGVTEQVITIAAIVEMGGLLKRGRDSYVSYYNFTTEKESDLLAELDVWNKLQSMKNINFKEIGVTKKKFNSVKAHIKKLKKAIEDQVEISSSDDRNAILKSCISGMATNLFIKEWRNDFLAEDGSHWSLDKHSCFETSYHDNIFCVAGKPKIFPVVGRYGKYQLEIITFATKVSKEMIEELFPNQVHKEITTCYDSYYDAVAIYTSKSYRGVDLGMDRTIDYNHPKYQSLKAEYEEEQERIRERRNRLNSYGGYGYENAELRQKTVRFAGKEFTVQYEFYSNPWINVDDETLFTTDENTLQLDNGQKVFFRNLHVLGRAEENIVALRNAAENSRLSNLRSEKKRIYARMQAHTIQNVLDNEDAIGKIQLTTNNGGFGDEPIYVYGAISLKKNTVSFEVMDDEERAAESTLEALQHLFVKAVEKKYPIRCFSAQKGKKKKVLTQKESKVKMEFDFLVRELAGSLTVKNVMENLEFLDEYYEDITKEIRKAS